MKSFKEEGGNWGIISIISAFMMQFLMFGATGSIGVFNVELLRHFDQATAVEISLIGAINFGVFLGSGISFFLFFQQVNFLKSMIVFKIEKF